MRSALRLNLSHQKGKKGEPTRHQRIPTGFKRVQCSKVCRKEGWLLPRFVMTAWAESPEAKGSGSVFVRKAPIRAGTRVVGGVGKRGFTES